MFQRPSGVNLRVHRSDRWLAVPLDAALKTALGALACVRDSGISIPSFAKEMHVLLITQGSILREPVRKKADANFLSSESKLRRVEESLLDLRR